MAKRRPSIVKCRFDGSLAMVGFMTRKMPAGWVRVAFAMFAVGWGANQFSPMLIVYRHALGLGATAIAVLAFAAGIGVQPAARRLEEYRTHAGVAAGLACAAVGAGIGAIAVTSADRVLAGVAAAFLGLAYGLCLVSGLRQAEHLAGAHDRGAVVACYYVLAYLGFAAPYAVDALNGPLGHAGTFAALAGGAAALAGWMGVRAVRARTTLRPDSSRTLAAVSQTPADSTRAWPPPARRGGAAGPS
jgi:hypothetical protein